MGIKLSSNGLYNQPSIETSRRGDMYEKTIRVNQHKWARASDPITAQKKNRKSHSYQTLSNHIRSKTKSSEPLEYFKLLGGFNPTPLKKIRVCQLGWWHSQYFWKNHPVMFRSSPPSSKEKLITTMGFPTLPRPWRPPVFYGPGDGPTSPNDTQLRPSAPVHPPCAIEKLRSFGIWIS